MHDAQVVGVIQCIGHCRHQLGGLPWRHFVRRQPVRQRHAFNEVTDEKGQTVGLAHLVKRHDARMTQLRYVACLAQEELAFSLPANAAARHFDGHNTIELRIMSAVDNAKGALPHGGNDLESADGATRRGIGVPGDRFRDRVGLVGSEFQRRRVALG